jgi:hypothetical protein
MKKTTIAVTALFFIALSALVFTSCQRERDTDLTEGEETALMERTGDDVVSITDQASTGQISQFKKERGGCATITIDTLSAPHTITVDFGATNCLCQDGKNRRGQIIRSFTGKYKDAGSTHTIRYNNYFINDNQLKGIKTVTNNGLNTAGNPNYTIDTKDTIIKANNAGTVTWMSNRNREYTVGFNTPVWSDDVFMVTGSGSGIRANGYSWSMNITTPLTIDCSCKYRIVAGELQIQPQGKPLRTLNYGSGACDDAATLTINNKVFAFNFK